ncbi:MAG: preprotein translocase subunit YajC [Myxococcales bacterium]
MGILAEFSAGGADAVVGALLAQGGGQGGLISVLPPILMMVVVFYFLILKPQQKQHREHQALISGLKKGDEVVTNGIVGRVHSVTERFVMVEVARDVRLRVLKTAIQAKVAEGTFEGADVKAEKTDK